MEKMKRFFNERSGLRRALLSMMLLLVSTIMYA